MVDVSANLQQAMWAVMGKAMLTDAQTAIHAIDVPLVLFKGAMLGANHKELLGEQGVEPHGLHEGEGSREGITHHRY